MTKGQNQPKMFMAEDEGRGSLSTRTTIGKRPVAPKVGLSDTLIGCCHAAVLSCVVSNVQELFATDTGRFAARVPFSQQQLTLKLHVVIGVLVPVAGHIKEIVTLSHLAKEEFRKSKRKGRSSLLLVYNELSTCCSPSIYVVSMVAFPFPARKESTVSFW